MYALSKAISPPQQVSPRPSRFDTGFAELLRGVGEEVVPGRDFCGVFREVSTDEGEECGGVGDERRGWGD